MASRPRDSDREEKAVATATAAAVERRTAGGVGQCSEDLGGDRRGRRGRGTGGGSGMKMRGARGEDEERKRRVGRWRTDTTWARVAS